MRVCPECGDDEACEGWSHCSDCLEKLGDDPAVVPVPTPICPHCAEPVTELIWYRHPHWYCSPRAAASK